MLVFTLDADALRHGSVTAAAQNRLRGTGSQAKNDKAPGLLSK